MKKTFVKLLMAVGLLAGVAACGPTKTSQQINYMQDVKRDTVMNMRDGGGILVQPMDMISIVVSHRDQELAAMFNLRNATYQAGAETQGGTTSRLMGYSVDSHGDIDFPIIGTVHVAGMNRWEVAQTIKSELEDRNLLRDAVITVQYMNFQISVLGEVARPGTYSINGDKISLLEAISRAGDLTIYGRRDNIQVTREENGKRKVYVVDLRSSDLYNSPAYYLRQNDVIYVEPNEVRAGQSTINENNFRSVRFWASLGSTALSAVNILITIITRTR